VTQQRSSEGRTGGTDALTAVYLTDEQAFQFAEFQRNYHVFGVLIECGLMKTSNGSLTLHFDREGRLANVESKRTLYKNFGE